MATDFTTTITSHPARATVISQSTGFLFSCNYYTKTPAWIVHPLLILYSIEDNNTTANHKKASCSQTSMYAK